MADFNGYAKGFKTKSGEIFGLDASAISGMPTTTGGSVAGVGLNAKNNLEISNRPDSTIANPVTTSSTGDKVNIVSNGSIQIKPGMKDESKAGEVAFDNEFNTADPYELKMHICNGAKVGDTDKYAKDTMALKLNVAEITLDTKKANEDKEEGATKGKFDPKEMKIRVCCDKWNKGKSVDGSAGPQYAKWEARAHDIRCFDHGGIALQIAGADGDNHENKIKFESDRTSGIGETPVYCGEGGKGVEFGTFNTEKASLYVGEYRFRGESKVYGVTRNNLYKNEKGKTDYEKQSDDFADVKDETKCATWNDIIKVARDYKNGAIGNTGDGGTQGGATADHTWADATAQFASKDSVYTIAQVDAKLAPIDFLGSVVSRKADNGNLEISAVNLKKWDVIDGEKIENEFPASLSIKAEEKVAIKAGALNLEGNSIVLPIEINKNGKVTVPGCEESSKNANAEAIGTAISANEPNFMINLTIDKNEFGSSDSDFAVKPVSEGVLFASVEEYNEGKKPSKQLTQEQWDALPVDDPKRYKILPFTEEDAANAQANIDEVMSIYPVGKTVMSVNLFDLMKLVEKVNALEEKVAELEAKHNAPEEPEVTE